MNGDSGPSDTALFSVVGVGASAGGLEAFSQLLQQVRPDTGFAFVLIQHLDPTHPSLLSETLARVTTMPVQQAEQGTKIEPGHVYVIAPNTDIALHEGRLVLSPRRHDGPKSRLPIDFFFKSLAAELHSQAIGVVLSGAASDGTEGLRAIREQDGITFAQAPGSAKFPSMPQSAIDAGVVDYCLDIPSLAEELERLSHHPYVLAPTPPLDDAERGVRAEIFARVRREIGIDFSEFKLPTVQRRLARRLAVRGVPDLQTYLGILNEDPTEVRALYEDMLIHVTSFFRDPQVFEALRTYVLPEIFKYKQDGATVRAWVAGCSTGEEVYSLAITLLEAADESPTARHIQVFGSDVSEVAIQKARAGIYSEHVMRDVSEERRKRFFTKVENRYHINKNVRDQCIFVRHDLVRDPPFSKLDLVSCRNVLIYFDQVLQKKVLPTLHYCLNQPGFLLLGRSENVAGLSQLFSLADKENKIFKRNAAPSVLRFAMRSDSESVATRGVEVRRGPQLEPSAAFARHLDRLLLARYCPPAVLVNQSMDVLLFSGATGAYLQAAPGKPQNNLIGMAPMGLIAALRTTIAEAAKDKAVVRCKNVEIGQDGVSKLCDLVVVPFSGHPEAKEPLFIVLFEELERGRGPGDLLSPADRNADGATDQRRSAHLEHELGATKEYMYSLIEEHGRTNDELGASNEELISGNEELQSMNEELATAKEELQSVNEELTTLNDELQRRNSEVSQVNTDLVNFAQTVDIPILTLDRQSRIRRFTPNVRSILNVLPSDVGRPIDDIKLNIDVPDVSAQIAEVLATAKIKESEVQDRSGHWYRMQIRPYELANKVIDGVILSLVDIHALKQLVSDAENARLGAERANHAKDDFLAVLSHELRTPLSSILLNAQRLRSGSVVDRADLQRAGEALERATWLQVKLIDDLLDVSRIIAGKLTLESRRVDLGSVVRAALDNVAVELEAKALALHLSIDPALTPIWADRVRVQQVVSNLLTNAIKFTPREGAITITVDNAPHAPHAPAFARLRVTDTGIGIEPEFLPQAFARFSQSDRSITRTYGGLGLGLALVRHLVEQQGGTAQAESPGKNQGATFTVTFPLATTLHQGTAELAHTPAPNSPLDRPGKKRQYEALRGLRVLVIDDDLRTREAIHEVLALAGANVTLADCAAAGMLAVEAWKPQVILCDIAMPVEDGYTFIRRVRARPEDHAAPIPALALTAMAAEADRRRALSAGFQLHLAKPIDIDRLRDAVLELAKLAGAPVAPVAPLTR